jgi:hypothetical protein
MVNLTTVSLARVRCAMQKVVKKQLEIGPVRTGCSSFFQGEALKTTLLPCPGRFHAAQIGER